MVEMDELIILATDDGPVRRYLRRMGLAEHVITRCVAKAERGQTVSIGSGHGGSGIPPLRLRCPDGLGFELTEARPGR
jgi:hypothetical protein